MLRSNAAFVRLLIEIADILLVIGAFVTVVVLRFAGAPDPTAYYQIHALVVLAGLPAWHLVLRFNGAYESLRLVSGGSLLLMIGKSVLAFALLQFTALYVIRMPELSRGVVITYPLVAGLYLLFFRGLGLVFLHRVRRSGFNTRTVLLVGANSAALHYARLVKTNLSWGLRVRGVLTLKRHDYPTNWPAAVPVLGECTDLATLLVNEPIDRVVFSLGSDGLDELPNFLAICEELGVESVFMPPSLEHLQVARLHVEDFFGMPVINYTTTPQQHVQLFGKRVLDMVASGLALILLAPLFLAMALAIKLTSPGPVFFKQARAGIRGRRFNCYKFRTMYVDAEERLTELRQHNEMDGPVFKMKDDPRITRVGALLRKYSFDELPQLMNVFRGDMSLVGPRPPLPAEVAQYEPWQRRRLSMKPGITCIWQVSGRNNIDFDQWMRLDLEYIDNWTLALDIKLLFRTIPAVLRGTGM